MDLPNTVQTKPIGRPFPSGTRAWRRRRPLLLLLPLPLLVLVLLLVVPAAVLLQYSFYTHEASRSPVPIFTLAHYARFLTDEFYLWSIITTLGSGLLVTAVSLILGYPVAYYYARSNFRFKGLLLVLLLSPFYMNMMVKIYGWMVILSRQGPVNSLLTALPFVGEPYSFLDNYLGLMIMLVYIQLPIVALSLIGPLQNIDDSLLASARVCGSSDTKVFTTIVLPLSLPGVLSASIFAFTLTISAFVVPLLVGGKIGYRFLSVIVYQNMSASQNWPFASAVAALLVIITLATIIGYTFVLKSTKLGVLLSEKFVG